MEAETQKEGRQREARGENGYLDATKRDLKQIFPAQLSVGTSTADTMTLNFQPPEQGDNTYLCLRHLVCGTSLWQTYQTNGFNNNKEDNAIQVH